MNNKFLINTSFIVFVFLTFTSCKKDSNPSLNCLVSSASLFERRIDIMYDENSNPMEIHDYSDTSYTTYYRVLLSYNSAGQILSAKGGYMEDSTVFEYQSNKIIEHQFLTSQPSMENEQIHYFFNSQRYLISDSLYAHYYGITGLSVGQFSNYEYDKNGNVIKIERYNGNASTNNLYYSVSYEYCDSIIPNNSYAFMRYGCIEGTEGSFHYILPHRTNLVVRDFWTTATTNWSQTYEYKFNTMKYPVNEITIRTPNPTYSTSFKYQCN
jgi:hypothetical protein